jgi:hypothetical protein
MGDCFSEMFHASNEVFSDPFIAAREQAMLL